jgi:hypothetical protein
MRNYESATGAPERRIAFSAPAQLFTRLCDKCHQPRLEGPGWKRVDKTWWHCPGCAAPAAAKPATPKTALSAAIEAAEVIEQARVESKAKPRLITALDLQTPGQRAKRQKWLDSLLEPLQDAHVQARREWLEVWLRERVERSDSSPTTLARHVGRCLLWTRETNKWGRPVQGHIDVRNRVYREMYGRSPDGFTIAPACGNRLCLRHLKAMTRSEHMSWLHQQGVMGRPETNAKRADTMRRQRSFCTMELAREVRLLKAQGVAAPEIVARTGLGPVTVRDIVSGRRWREPPPRMPVPQSSIFRLAGAAA